VTIEVLRWQPASGSGKHRVHARYVELSSDQFDCTPGPNLLEITRVRGAKFAAGRYELVAVEHSHRHVAAFTVTG
jgi:hypothetical protein